MESQEEFKHRHAVELKEFEKKSSRIRAGVPKKDRSMKQRVNEEIEEQRKALLSRQAQELKEAGVTPDAAAADNADVPPDAQADPDDAAGPKLSKKEKRRRAKEAKDLEEEARSKVEKAAAGPSEREIETAALTRVLHPLGLTIHHIKPDGNCLFSSVSHQLKINSSGSGGAGGVLSAKQLREATAAHIRGNPGEYFPFITAADFEGGGEGNVTMDEYCENLAKPSVWGGQVEIRAMTEVLDVPVEVYAADMPVLKMGPTGGDKAPLRLSYHRKYYGLGEHYNSVVPD
mmetsp:Transcript_21944/g.54204  ORF Transcript_21944/g.54204 Transcript_21944/m.54204 type:complete len:288 (-) Transcript_21944:576-1439(-)